MNITDVPYSDYATFTLLVCILMALHLYMKFKASTNVTKAEYVFGKKTSTLSMLMSMGREYLGIKNMLGAPGEIFYKGTAMYEIVYGLLLAYPVVSYLFIPVYYNLGITSVYQYLDMRFKSSSTRYLTSGLYILCSILNTSVIVFTSCLALKVIVNFPYWSSIIGIGVISIICSVMGGLKVQIIADSVIGTISTICMAAIIIRGADDVGGFQEVWQINTDWGRVKFFNFDLNPEIQVTTISAFVGQFFISVSILGCQQHFVQRYSSVQSLRKVRKILWLSIPMGGLLHTLFWLGGAVIFANYATCDPRRLGYINKIDEILPFYVENTFGEIPGCIGLFMGAFFNGSLSSICCKLNSLATVTWEDFISKISYFKSFKDNHELLAIRILVILHGIVVIGLAFGVALLPGILSTSKLLTSATTGSLLGVFILAMFIPVSNSKGAAVGVFISLILVLVMATGQLFTHKPNVHFLPTSIKGCTNETFRIVNLNRTVIDELLRLTNTSDSYYSYTVESTTQEQLLDLQRSFWDHLFSISFMYYAFIGTFVCVLVGVTVSYLTGHSENDIYEEKLIHPLALKISRCLPGKPRKFSPISNAEQTENTNEPVKSKLEQIYNGEKFDLTDGEKQK